MDKETLEIIKTLKDHKPHKMMMKMKLLFVVKNSMLVQMDPLIMILKAWMMLNQERMITTMLKYWRPIGGPRLFGISYLFLRLDMIR